MLQKSALRTMHVLKHRQSRYEVLAPIPSPSFESNVTTMHIRAFTYGWGAVPLQSAVPNQLGKVMIGTCCPHCC